MSYIVQWIVVAVAVIAASVYLYNRIKSKGSGCACDGNCSNCGADTRKLYHCNDEEKHQ